MYYLFCLIALFSQREKSDVGVGVLSGAMSSRVVFLAELNCVYPAHMLANAFVKEFYA
jgi:hypothetical protein